MADEYSELDNYDPYSALDSYDPAQEPAGLGTKALNTLESLGRLAYDTPGNIVSYAANLNEGSRPLDKTNWADQATSDATKRLNERTSAPDANDPILPFGTKSDLAQVGVSLPFSIGSMGAALAAGGLATAVTKNPYVGYTAGATAAGSLAYRADTSMFMNSAIDAFTKDYQDRNNGQAPSRDLLLAEQERLQPYAQNHGLWEAMPEAAGSVVGGKIVSSVFKGAGNLAWKAGRAAAGLALEELPTETITQHGQHNTEIDAGIAPGEKRSFTSPSDIATSFGEVVKPVLLQSLLMGGGATAIKKAYDYAAARKQKLEQTASTGPLGNALANGGFTNEGQQQTDINPDNTLDTRTYAQNLNPTATAPITNSLETSPNEQPITGGENTSPGIEYQSTGITNEQPTSINPAQEQSQSTSGPVDKVTPSSPVAFEATHELNDGTPVQQIGDNTFVDQAGDEWGATDARPLQTNSVTNPTSIAAANPLTQAENINGGQESTSETQNANAQEKGLLNPVASEQSGATPNIEKIAEQLHSAISSDPSKTPSQHFSDIVTEHKLTQDQADDVIDSHWALQQNASNEQANQQTETQAQDQTSADQSTVANELSKINLSDRDSVNTFINTAIRDGRLTKEQVANTLHLATQIKEDKEKDRKAKRTPSQIIDDHANPASSDISNAIDNNTTRAVRDNEGNITHETIDYQDAALGVEALIENAKKGRLTKDRLGRSQISQYVGTSELAGLKQAIDDGNIIHVLEKILDNLHRTHGGQQDQSTDVTFQPTHELNDGTPVVSHGIGEGFWNDKEGNGHLSFDAKPIRNVDTRTDVTPSYATAPLLNKRTNKPFKTRKMAEVAIASSSNPTVNQQDHIAVPVDGGFGIAPKPNTLPGNNDTTTETQSVLSNTGTNTAGVTASTPTDVAEQASNATAQEVAADYANKSNEELYAIHDASESIKEKDTVSKILSNRRADEIASNLKPLEQKQQEQSNQIASDNLYKDIVKQKTYNFKQLYTLATKHNTTVNALVDNQDVSKFSVTKVKNEKNVAMFHVADHGSKEIIKQLAKTQATETVVQPQELVNSSSNDQANKQPWEMTDREYGQHKDKEHEARRLENLAKVNADLDTLKNKGEGYDALIAKEIAKVAHTITPEGKFSHNLRSGSMVYNSAHDFVHAQLYKRWKNTKSHSGKFRSSFATDMSTQHAALQKAIDAGKTIPQNVLDSLPSNFPELKYPSAQESAKKPEWEMTRDEYKNSWDPRDYKDSNYDKMIHAAVFNEKLTQAEADKKLIRDYSGNKYHWAKTRKELEQDKKEAVKTAKAARAESNKNPIHSVKWAQKSESNTAKNNITSTNLHHNKLLEVHQERVQEALSEGKPVPQEVLADYPDLKSPVQATATSNTAPATKDSKKLGLAITRAAKIENRVIDDMPGSYNQGSEHHGIDIHSINQVKDANGNTDYIVDVSNHTRVASNGHKTVDGKYSLNQLLSSGAISQKTHDFFVSEHDQATNASPETSNDHELTAQQYVDRENKSFPGNKKINDSLRKLHYTAIRSHLDQGGKISQEVFDSLDGLHRTNLKNNYGEGIIKSPVQENTNPIHDTTDVSKKGENVDTTTNGETTKAGTFISKNIDILINNIKFDMHSQYFKDNVIYDLTNTNKASISDGENFYQSGKRFKIRPDGKHEEIGVNFQGFDNKLMSGIADGTLSYNALAKKQYDEAQAKADKEAKDKADRNAKSAEENRLANLEYADTKTIIEDKLSKAKFTNTSITIINKDGNGSNKIDDIVISGKEYHGLIVAKKAVPMNKGDQPWWVYASKISIEMGKPLTVLGSDTQGFATQKLAQVYAMRMADAMGGNVDSIAYKDINPALKHVEPSIGYSPMEYMRAVAYGGDPFAKVAIKKDSSLTTKGTVVADKAENNIQDFGEKLEGAKKFTYTFKEALSEDIDISAVPLSKSFPQPDYEKLIAGGIKPQVAALIAQLRAEIPTKPSKSYRVSKWTAQVTAIREAADHLLSGKLTVEQFIQAGKDKDNYTKYMGDVLAIADSILPSQIRELGNFKLEHTLYGLHSGVKDVWKWSVVNTASKSSWGKQFDTKEEAVAYIKSEISTENTKGESIAKFDRWTERGKPGVVFVGKKIASGKYITLKEFPTSKEALNYTIEHNAELVELLKQKKKDKEIRRAENNQRVGKDYRNGKNVSAKEFTDTFGFRGVQFGSWVENDRRQQDLNNAYDGLIDLAEVLGIPPKALALNGELGLAFGARGTGGEKAAAAHYEANQVVINLTKAHGAGSLAHEWWHAVDNYFGKQEGSGFLSDKGPRRAQILDGNKYRESTDSDFAVRKEVFDAWQGITKAIKTETQLAKRSAIKDKTRSKDYYSTVIEMTARTFERYIIGKLADQGYENDYLANIIPAPILEKESELDNEDYAYPLQSEMAAVNKAYDKLFETLETKETDQGTALFSRRSDMASGAVSLSEINTIINRVIANSIVNFGRETIIIAPRFNDLPMAIQEEAERQGYDNKDTNDRIPGVTYKGKIYLIHENIQSKDEVEETLLHERIHQILRGDQSDLQGIKLRTALNDLYVEMGRIGGINTLAYNLGINLNVVRKQALKIPHGPARAMYIVDEFLAEAEGRRAYERLPQKIHRALREFFGKLRAWLKDNGYHNLAKKMLINLDEFTPSDLAQVLHKIRTQDLGVGSDAIQFHRVQKTSPKLKVNLSDVTESGGHFATGIPVTFKYVHNTQSYTDLLGKKGKPPIDSPYGRGYEPSGQFLTVVGRHPAERRSEMEYGEVTFNNPLVIDNDSLNWKQQLSDSFGGKTGKYLSEAVIQAGYDGIVTTENGHTSEVVNLTNFDKSIAKYSKSTTPVVNPHSKTTLNQAVTKAMDTLFGQGWTNRLMATGKFKMISAAEATGIIGKNAMFHKVWHGSPHDHNKFDSAYIDTGEGAQAFGWGHYFSDLKTVAEWYRDTLQNKQLKLLVDGKDVTSLLRRNWYETDTTESRALGILLDELKYPNMWSKTHLSEDKIKSIIDETIIKQMPRLGANDPNHLKRLEKTRNYLSELKNKKLEIGGGKLYEVDLAPNQDEYLDWDKPLSQQSDVVKAGLKELHKQLEGDLLNEYLDRINADWIELTGQELYQNILDRSHQDGLFDHPDIYDRSVPNDEASSYLLHSLGIRGIRYKAEQGQSDANNYVVFNDADVKIEVKYSKNGDVIAFYNPADDTTYLVHDNITQNISSKALVGLMLHEIGVHALTLGQSNEVFKDILRRFEALKATNPKVQAAFNRVPKGTKAKDIVEEALAYYLEENPKSSLAQRIVEWFRQAVRALGKTLPVLERAKFSQWANKLTEAELIGMATSALKSAPDSLQFDNVGRNREGIKLSYDESVDAALDGKSKGALNLGDTPLALVKSGMPKLPLMITEKVIDKAHFDHGLSAKFLKSLPDLLSNPLMVFKSDTQAGSFVVITHATQSNKPVMVAIKPSGEIENIKPVNIITSAYGKPSEVIINWIKKGLLLASDKKSALAFATTNGVRFPTVIQSINKSLAINVEQNNKIVNTNNIKFSRSTPSNTPADNSAMRSFFAPAKGTQALGWLAGGFQRNHLIDFVAQDLPELINYKLLSQEKDNFTNQRENKIGESYKEMMDKMDAKTMHELGRVQGIATRLVTFDPATADYNTPMTEEERAVYDAYSAMPEGAKEAYATMRDAYQADLMEKKNALIERIKAFPADKETQAEIIRTIEKHFDQFKEGVYFPLNRDGAIIVKATNQEGELVVEHVATQAAAYKLVQEMTAQGYDNTHIIGKDAYDRDLLAGNAANEMAILAHKTISDLKEKSIQGKLTESDFNDLFSEFNQLLINTLPDSSYRKHFIHRKGTLGESTDTLRAYAKTRTSAVKMIAALTYDHQIQDVLNNADKTIKEMDKVAGSDTLAIKSIVNELKLREAALKSTEINAVSQILTSLGFIGALGFNIGSAAVNMLQVVGVALPELVGKHGYVEATKEISAAYKLLFNPANLDKASGLDITKNPKLTAIEKQAMEYLASIGKISLTMTHDSIAAGKNPSYSSNPLTRAFGGAAKYSGYFFHVAEAANRQVTGMAAFNLAYQKNGGDFKAAIADAIDVIDRTQFDYGQGNRARYMMSNTARVLTLFKSYALGMSYFIGRNAYQSMKGETPEVRLQAKKTLVASMAMSFATAGLFGMPIGLEAFAAIGGVSAFKYKGAKFAVPGAIGGMLIFQALLAGLGADDEDELETEFRNWLTDNFDQTTAEWVTKGPARLLPIGDISGRTSSSEFWWRSQNKQLEGTDQYNAIATALIGPIGSQVAGLFTAKKMYEDGQYSRMVESMSPAFLRNAIAANRMGTEGVTNLKGDKIIQRDLTTGELINKVIGFNPTVITNAYDANSAIAKESTKHTLAKSHLVNRWISGDATERSDLMKGAIKDFNKSVPPSERITLKSLFKSRRSRKGIDKHTKNGLYLSKKQNYLRDIGRFNRQE